MRFVGAYTVDTEDGDEILDILDDHFLKEGDEGVEYLAFSTKFDSSYLIVSLKDCPPRVSGVKPCPLPSALSELEHYGDSALWLEPTSRAKAEERLKVILRELEVKRPLADKSELEASRKSPSPERPFPPRKSAAPKAVSAELLAKIKESSRLAASGKLPDQIDFKAAANASEMDEISEELDEEVCHEGSTAARLSEEALTSPPSAPRSLSADGEAKPRTKLPPPRRAERREADGEAVGLRTVREKREREEREEVELSQSIMDKWTI